MEEIAILEEVAEALEDIIEARATLQAAVFARASEDVAFVLV